MLAGGAASLPARPSAALAAALHHDAGMTRSRPFPRELPKPLEPLAELALDLRWTWSHNADQIWRSIDAGAWDSTRNPWLILNQLPSQRLDELSRDHFFRDQLAAVLKERHRYTSRPALKTRLTRPVLYFSMEYAVGEAVPFYAGGLGVLAGDHLKASADLGVPLIAVGLMYQEGYFRQMIDMAGRQIEVYPYNDPTTMPLRPVLSPSGAWLTIPLDLPGRRLDVRAWRAKVGGLELLLLDSNIPSNEPIDRGITGKLYDDAPDIRLRQELVLGLAGWRLIEALGIAPGACHLNEGHTGFVVLERARSAMQAARLTFPEALTATRAGNVFTTHTPVRAGIDAFPVALVEKYLGRAHGYVEQLGIPFAELCRLGQPPGASADAPFRPTYLAIRGAGRINAVSARHAETSRRIFGALFPRRPEAEVPITHITNGVHVPSWRSHFADAAVPGAELSSSTEPTESPNVAQLDDETLWNLRAQERARLVEVTRARLARQLARRGGSPGQVAAAQRALDPDVLTVGFARRFAEYKRPNLLLRDRARLRRLLGHPTRPVQLLIAGKAHPDDEIGKAFLADWMRFVDEPEMRSRCAFIEDYDLTVAQELVQGVDVWINTPRPPWEACGTSGMKVLVNGGLNLSVLDGWWAEAFHPDVGWALRGGDDDADAQDLFRVLEREVVPCFYDRTAPGPGPSPSPGLPLAWIRRVRASLARLTPRYSAERMVREYVQRMYEPAEAGVVERLADGGAKARQLADLLATLRSHWGALRFGRLDAHATAAGQEISVEVYLDDLAPDHVDVELYADALPGEREPEVLPMDRQQALVGTSHGFLFRATIPGGRPAAHYTPRLVPARGQLLTPLETELVLWHH